MPEIEIGTSSNPIVFSGVIAGQTFEHPNNPFYLWNDKGGLLSSVDAREITVNVLAFNITNELLGFSSGALSQTFTVAFPPVLDDSVNYPTEVKVNGLLWSRVTDFSSSGPTDEVYVWNYATGVITFGNNINGKVPPSGNTIEASYTPNEVLYGTEVQRFDWFGIQSVGVISNPVTVSLEREFTPDTTHVNVLHTKILSVSGVWLGTDPHRLGTNYYTGGSFDANTGVVTLGTAVTSANTEVLVDYVYTIVDDAEADYTQVGVSDSHQFVNPIPSNNAKALRLRLKPPATTSPSGLMNIRFRIRLSYRA